LKYNNKKIDKEQKEIDSIEKKVIDDPVENSTITSDPDGVDTSYHRFITTNGGVVSNSGNVYGGGNVVITTNGGVVSNSGNVYGGGAVGNNGVVITTNGGVVSNSGNVYGGGNTESGPVVKETRALQGYNKTSLNLPARVTLKKSDTNSVEINANKDVIQKIDTNIKNGNLIISNNDSFYTNQGIEIILYTTKVPDSFSVVGYGTFIVPDDFGDIRKLNLQITGSGDIEVKGNVKILSANIAGSGDINVSGEVEDASLNVSGSGDISAKGITKSVDATVSGAGNIKYDFTGEENNEQTNITGIGKINSEGMEW